MKYRTRYAPSPTGFLHIGGARTALFNYLLAKSMNGDFVIRIEDTDIERNVDGGIDSQLDFLKWMGIEADESIRNPKQHGPYIQSLKLQRYQQLADDLIKQRKAYRCFCTKEQLENDRLLAEKNQQTPKYNRRCLHLSQQEIQKRLDENQEFTVRLQIDDKHTYEWEDLIRGKISIPGSALTDPVILKSNKIAMYNFAVVVDDFDMEITNVVRGEEHISNTPYQLAIANALGYDSSKIKYGHLSIIVDETGKKLSKRNKDLKQFISDYENDGYFPHAVTNFVSLLGWSPKDNKEVMSLGEMIANFDINHLSKSPAFFDINKMNWFSNQYFNKMDENAFVNFISNHPLTKEVVIKDSSFVNKSLLFKSQIYNLKQLISLVDDVFLNNQLKDEDLLIIKQRNGLDVILKFNEYLKNSNEFSENSIKDIIKKIQSELNKKGLDLFMPIRISTTWMSHGPELAKTIYLLEKQKVLDNLKKVIDNLK